MNLVCLSVRLSVRPPDNFLKYALIFNTLQRKLKSVNEFGLSICPSVPSHDNFRKYSLKVEKC
jgi:hypothetical protein